MGTSCMQICSNGENEIINQIFPPSGSNQRRDEKNPFKSNIISDINEINSFNNKIVEEIPEYNKYDIFKQKFESKLPEFGEYISHENFYEKLPMNARSDLSKNKFQIPNDININNELYQMKPIKFKNDNIYWGNWNENIIMDGEGKYYIEAGKIFIQGVWDNGKSIYGRIYYPSNNIYEGYINN